MPSAASVLHLTVFGRLTAVAITFIATFASVASSVGLVPVVAHAGACAVVPYHWWSVAISGTGSTVAGTGAYTTTWATWSVDHSRRGSRD